MKTLTLGMLLLAVCASSASAQKDKGKSPDPKSLAQQTKAFITWIEKLKAAAGKKGLTPDQLRLIAEKKKYLAEWQAKEKYAASKNARAAYEKQRQIAERLLKEKLADAQRARAEAEKRRYARTAKGRDAWPRELREAQERMEHLHAAMKHLQAAGMKDLAAETTKRAAQLGREVHYARKKFEDGQRRDENHKKEHSKGEHHKGSHRDAGNDVRDLHLALKKLYQQVEKLQQSVERLERRK